VTGLYIQFLRNFFLACGVLDTKRTELWFCRIGAVVDACDELNSEARVCFESLPVTTGTVGLAVTHVMHSISNASICDEYKCLKGSDSFHIPPEGVLLAHKGRARLGTLHSHRVNMIYVANTRFVNRSQAAFRGTLSVVERCGVVGNTLAFGLISHGFESEHRLFSHQNASAFSELRSLA